MPSISHLLLFIASTDALRTPSNSRRGVITGAAASATLLNAVPPAFAQGKKPRSDPSYGVVKSPAEWKEYLTDYQYFVLREGGTEPPNTSPLYKEKRAGKFICAGCPLPLFESTAKFESGTGWPSFAKPIEGNVEVMSDNALVQIALGSEVRCAKCGGHLGDVFADGLLFPGTMAALTGKRFCIDGTSLYFEAADGSARVSGESKPYSKPADVELPSWLQPPPVPGSSKPA